MGMAAVQPAGLFKMTAPTSAATLVSGSRQLCVSGQVPLDANGAVVGLGDVEAQARQTLHNFRLLVEEAGATMKDVARITVYLTDRDALPAIMKVRREVFSEPYPATTVLVVAGLVSPDWLVEIEGAAIF